MSSKGRNPQKTAGGALKYRIGGIALTWILLGFMMVWIVLPLLWAVLSTFKTPIEIYKVPIRILPSRFNFGNYVKVLSDSRFPRYLMNTVMLTAVTTLLTIFVSMWAAYGFAQMRFPFHHTLLLLVLVPRLIPRISLVIPLYRTIVQLGLLNTYAALVITYTVTSIPFAVWILTDVFRSIPREIGESAFMDGANLLRLLWRIMLPIAIPGVVAVVIFTARESWNEFPFVLSFTTSAELRTLPYQLFLFRDTLGIEDWPLINTFAIITILPLLAAYFFFAKHVTSSIVRGAVKL